jgi:Domain of unknown function (DUF4342)
MEHSFYEEFKVRGKDLVEKIKSLVHEGNVRRIILKDEKGQTFLEIPLTVAAVGAIAVPLLAALEPSPRWLRISHWWSSAPAKRRPRPSEPRGPLRA